MELGRVKVSDVLNAVKKLKISDADIEGTCKICHATQLLTDTHIISDQDDTIYTCKNGCGPIVKVEKQEIGYSLMVIGHLSYDK
jgi:hypothetical protein